METDTHTQTHTQCYPGATLQLQSLEQCWYLICAAQLYKFGRINRGWYGEGLHATSLLQPSGKKPPLWDDLITGKEGTVIRGETGG